MRNTFEQGWTINARLRGDRQARFHGLTAPQALAAYRRLTGGRSLAPSLRDELAEVAGLTPILDQIADVQEVTIEGPKGEELFKLPAASSVDQRG